MLRFYEQYAFVPLKGLNSSALFFMQTYFANNTFKICILCAFIKVSFAFNKIKARAKGLFFCCSAIVLGAVLQPHDQSVIAYEMRRKPIV